MMKMMKGEHTMKMVTKGDKVTLGKRKKRASASNKPKTPKSPKPAAGTKRSP